LLVIFTLEELKIPWDYFLKSVRLKEQEQVPNSKKEGDASEEVRVSSDPGRSMKLVQTTMVKGIGPKTRNTLPKTNRPETPIEDSPHMKLR